MRFNRPMFARKPLLAAALSIVALVLTACGTSPTSSGAAGNSTTLNFMVAEYSAKTAPFWNQTIAGFEKANPGTKVNLQVVGWQQMHDTTTQRIAAGTMPDLLNTAAIWVPEWADAGAIQPVSSTVVPATLQSAFVPTFLTNSATYKGQVWGLPIAGAARGMFYNKDLFTKAGLDPNSPPTTWQALLADAKQIKARTGSYGYAFDAKGVQAFRYFGYFLWNAGGNFFDSSGKAAFNSPQGIQAMQFLVDLAKSGAVPNPVSQQIETLEPLFTAGKVGMLIDGNYLASTIAASGHGMNYGVAQVPVSAPGVSAVTWGVADTLVIGKKANNALVTKFIQYIYQPSVRTTFDTNEGNLPVLKSQATDPAFQDPTTQGFIKLMPSARFDPLNPNYSKMQTLITTAMQQAITGAKGAAAALNDAASQFNKLAS
jgi:multiple sugar transport system substrate-binding protein